jgi:hypothetical protein
MSGDIQGFKSIVAVDDDGRRMIGFHRLRVKCPPARASLCQFKLHGTANDSLHRSISFLAVDGADHLIVRVVVVP